MHDAAASLGLDLSPPQLEKLDSLRRLLQEGAVRTNLTSILETSEIELKHIVDSLAVAMHGWSPLSGAPPRNVLDLGSGAGFPALPLAIVFPEVRVTAIERSWKKAEFISLTAMQLGLEVVVVAKQVETEARLPVLRERFDLVLARAVAYLPTLAEYCLPCTRVGGRFVAMKSESLQEEIDDGLYAIERLGGRLLEPIPYEIPGVAGTRWLLVVEKAAPTPEEFPREPGEPSRRPLTGPGVKIAKPERKRRRLSNSLD